jgi:hypothetical protein
MYIGFQPVVGWKAQMYWFGGFSLGAVETSGNGRSLCFHVGNSCEARCDSGEELAVTAPAIASRISSAATSFVFELFSNLH